MVITRSGPAMFALLMCLSVSAAPAPDFTADSLRVRLNAAAENREDVLSRFKAGQVESSNLRLLSDREINYKLPNGTYVLGTLLENGMIAPSIRRDGKVHPACVTSDYRLIEGHWNKQQAAIVCDLQQTDSFAILENMAPQIKSGEPLAGEGADKYSSSMDAKDPHGTNKAPRITSTQEEANKYSPEKGPDGRQKATPNPAHTSKPSEAGGSAQKYGNRAPSPTGNAVASHLYIPPDRDNDTSKFIAGVLSNGSQRFGISLGTWASVSLARPVSSAESGVIEFTLDETLPGKYRDLPAGTVFFANKAINMPTRKLEAMTVTALLPDGSEIQIQARVFSLDQTAGLPGVIERDREGELSTIGSKAALNALALATPQISGVTGSALNDVTDGLINTEEKNVQKQPNAVIKVAPQRCLLKVVKTF